jgi:hypothetical protein
MFKLKKFDTSKDICESTIKLLIRFDAVKAMSNKKIHKPARMIHALFPLIGCNSAMGSLVTYFRKLIIQNSKKTLISKSPNEG